jgi:predicted phage terminase large subunit-like protein
MTSAADARAKADQIARNVHLVRSSPFIPIEPTELQWAFLCDDRPEVLFAGGTGGGKSVALLAGALMWVHIPGYSATLFRKTFPDLMMPAGLIPLAAQWLTNTDARKHDGGKKWSFPSGATLTFAHLENPQDRFKYAGLETQYLGWDEIAQMEQESYLFLKSRMRRSVTTSPDLAAVPMRIRATANPGHKHARWVKNYWISDDDNKPIPYDPNKLHIASTLDDNPHLDREDYAARLEELSPVERAQMRHGDWAIMPEGNMFREENFVRVPGRMDRGGAYRIRMWDLAGSAKKKSDYCAGVLVARSKATGIYRVEHVIHEKLEPGPLDRKMRETAELDGKDVWVGLEEEKSGSGKLVSAHFRRLLRGYVVRPQRPTGDKVERAGLASSLVDRNEVELTIAPWNEKFVSECVGFPAGANDDMVDAFAYACHVLSRMPVSNSNTTASDSEAPASKPPGGMAGGGASELPRFLVNRMPDSQGGSRRRLPSSGSQRPTGGLPPWATK